METLPSLDSGRHPFELFVLYLGMVSGAPLLWGAPAPGSTTSLLGPTLARAWGWILVLGCFVALTGVWWTWWRWLSRLWPRACPSLSTGLLIERVGLVAVGVGTIIYAAGVIAAGEPPGRLVAAALVAGMGFAAWWRAWQIQRWVQAVLRVAGNADR